MGLLIAFVYLSIVVDHAHLVCPIGLAWSNRQFRSHMLIRAGKYIGLPAICLCIPFFIGAMATTSADPLFRLERLAAFTLNAWHFGAQNYGVCAWSGGSLQQRQAAFVLTVLPLALLPVWWHGLLWLALIDLGLSVTHWAQDLRLSSMMAPRAFLAGALLVGVVGLAFKGVVVGDSRLCGPMLACSASRGILALIGLRDGLLYWHILMSRWVWSLEGRTLLA